MSASEIGQSQFHFNEPNSHTKCIQNFDSLQNDTVNNEHCYSFNTTFHYYENKLSKLKLLFIVEFEFEGRFIGR